MRFFTPETPEPRGIAGNAVRESRKIDSRRNISILPLRAAAKWRIGRTPRLPFPSCRPGARAQNLPRHSDRSRSKGGVVEESRRRTRVCFARPSRDSSAPPRPEAGAPVGMTGRGRRIGRRPAAAGALRALITEHIWNNLGGVKDNYQKKETFLKTAPEPPVNPTAWRLQGGAHLQLRFFLNPPSFRQEPPKEPASTVGRSLHRMSAS